jgi:predicted transcriptional regulator
VIDPAERPDGLRGLAWPARARMLRLLHRRPGLNVNDIARALNLLIDRLVQSANS